MHFGINIALYKGVGKKPAGASSGGILRRRTENTDEKDNNNGRGADLGGLRRQGGRAHHRLRWKFDAGSQLYMHKTPPAHQTSFEELDNPLPLPACLGDYNSLRPANSWEEIDQLKNTGFNTVSRQDFEMAKALELNDNFWNFLAAVRKGLGIPKQGFHLEKTLRILSETGRYKTFARSMYKKWNREQAQITCAFNFIRPELHEWLYTLTLGNCIAASRRPQGITMELYRVEPSRLHIHLTVPKYTTHSALKQFITAKYKLLNPKLAELNKNTFNMSKRDLKIFKLGYFKKMSFPEIAEEILQEFPSTKLDSGLIKKIYYRASNKISQLFMGRPWQLQFEKNTKHTTPKKI